MGAIIRVFPDVPRAGNRDNPWVADGRAPGGYLTAQHARWLAERPDRRWQALDGTLLFADVSGFTVLGERLAKQGRIGAEILTETVNTVFAGMLDVVTYEGGEILKFGGDAVLALFTGPNHAMRGCSAGLGMQAMLRALRRERSVNLRLSAGVATGTAHLFLAGAAPREMIVAGPLATEVLTFEAAAEAGQVLVSPATAEGLPGHCLGPGGVLKATPAVPPSAPPALPTAFDPRPGLPLHLHGHEPGDAEHRAVTVAFVQFRGTDALLAAEGPDALAYALDDVVGAAADAALSHGITFVGTDVDRDAGKVILAAGAPTASPDDDDRMLHALREIVGTPRRLDVRAGVNRGRVFTVDIGPERRRTWTVMGDDVNLAARVMGRAEPGTVLATGSVLARLRDDFARTPIPPFAVKGKKAPVFAEEIGEARGARRANTGIAPLVGREREMAELREALTEARMGAHRVVELVGEPGIGKSRLIEALDAEVGATPRVLVQGGPYAAHSPYRALRLPLRRLLGCGPDDPDAAVAERLRERAAAIDARLAPWLPLIAIPFGLELPLTPETASLAPQFARGRLNAWTGRLIDGLLPPGPCVLLVEDAHWLDEASGDLLEALARGRRPGGSLVVSTRREGTAGLRLGTLEGAVTLAIGPLPPSALMEMVGEDDDDGAVLPPGTESRLVERAAGNPLLLQELLAAARAGDRVDALPDTVEALITARIDTLPRSDRRLLREAAVLGAQVSSPTLGRLLGLDAFAVQSALQRLDDFLVPSGPQTVRFRHGLLRDAAYETLPYRRRRELHARAAALLERDAGDRAAEQAELLALHYHAARRWPETWRWARVAATQASRRAAPVEAAGFLAKALDAGRALPGVEPRDLATVAEELGDAGRLAARFDTAAAAYREARRRVRGDAVAEAALCLKEGRLRDDARHVAQSLRWYSAGLRRLNGAESDVRAAAVAAQLTLAHGATRLRAGRLRECLPYLHRALEHARAVHDRATMARAYFLLDAVYTDLGAPEAELYRDLALPIYEELGDYGGQARVLNNLGINEYYAGRWDAAVELYERCRAANERIGDVIESATAQNNIAEIRLDQGRLDEAEAMLREALHTFRAAGFRIGAGVTWGNLGRIAGRRGDIEGAAEIFARGRAELESVGSASFAMDMDAHEIERLLFAGDNDGALRLAGRVRATADRLGSPPTRLATLQRLAGYAKLQAGDVEAARTRFLESLDFARSVDASFSEALALEALGRAGDEAAARQASAIFPGLGVVATPPVRLAA